MKEFLRQIAQKFYSEYGKKNDLADFLFVFPNRRPGLFFKKYLSELAQNPIFSPQVLTINEFFQQFSSLKQEDNIALLFRLFEVFKEVVNEDEKFDQFIAWGQMLLNDFNDIDNYCVDADKLFQNIVEEKELEQKFDFLEDDSEQFEIIKKFWNNIPSGDERKTYTQNFIEIWSKLPEVYNRFKESLLGDGVAYNGMLCRNAVENLKTVEMPYRKVVFVGFNALNGTERALFQFFKQKGIADFYWDNCSQMFFAETANDNNAMRFLQNNIKEFPSRFSLEIKDQQKETFEVLSLPSSVAQTKQVYNIIKNLHQNEEDKSNLIKTAIVLPDEKLLLPQLYSLPEEIVQKKDDKEKALVNVTMGYPLDVAPINSLVEYLFDLHKNARQKEDILLFYFENVLAILNHPYVYSNDVQMLIDRFVKEKKFWIEYSLFEQNNELLKKIFSNNVNENNFVTYLSDVISQLQSLWEEGHNDLEKAFAFCYITVLNRVNTQIDKSNLSVSFSSLYLILKQLVRNVKMPFEGEPLSGLQIMGVLETRSLDFENLIITSLNEDIFPKKQSSDSSIPYALRKAFGLPTYEHQDALQAYYFYRLIASAKRVFLLYDSRADKISDHGEMSRFIYQLCYRYKQIQLEDEKKLSYSVATNGDKVVEVKKTKEILDELAKKRFSASALNEYFSCPLKFYFSRVANIDEKEELSEKIENNVFGSIVHYTLELLYNKYKNKEVTAEQIDLMLKDKKNLEDCLKKAFSKEYLNKDEIVEPKGRFKLVLEIIKKYVERVLEFDKKKTPFTYIESEKSVNVSFSIGKRAVNFYGKIDRLHKKDGTTHVVDYKTGSSKKMDSKDIDFLFDKDERSKKDLAAVFQTIFYSLLLRLGGEKGEIQPDIYYIRSLFDESFYPEIPCKFSEIEKEFKDNLSKLMEEIFDEKVSFTQANKDSNICKFCSYKIICGREDLKKNDF